MHTGGDALTVAVVLAKMGAEVELNAKVGNDAGGKFVLSELKKNGVDEDFGKNARNLKPIVQGPFYAIFGKMATDGAFGGVLVNPKCEVYRADKQGVIPGFYAAGDNASGVQANAGKPGDYRMKAFTDYQWAVDGGYLSAQSCAEYLTK